MGAKAFTFSAAIALFILAIGCGSEFAQTTEGDVAVDEYTITFPQTAIGRSSNLQFQIRNTGDGDLILTGLEITNASPYIAFSSGFITDMSVEFDWRANEGGQSWASSPPFSLRAGGEIQVDVLFSPDDSDPACPSADPLNCGSIVITTNDRDEPTISVQIALQQSAGLIAVDPTVLEFADIIGGPYSESFVITNEGDGPLTIQSVSDPNVEGITMTELSNRQEPYNLQIGQTAEYSVTFSPVGGVDYCPDGIDGGCSLGQINIQSNDALGNQVVVLIQVGSVAAPNIQLSVDELEFTQAAVGTPETLSVDVTNTGANNLNWNVRIDPTSIQGLFGIEVDGTAVTSAGQQMDPIAPDNTEVVYITYEPDTEDRSIDGELEFRTNDPDESIARVGLIAGPPNSRIDVRPAQLWFPETVAGATSELQFFIVNSGRATLNITSATWTSSEEFSIPDLTSAFVAPGDQRAVTVTYTRPTDDFETMDHGVLTIVSDADTTADTRVDCFAYHDADILPPTAVITVDPAAGTYTVGDTITLDGSTSTPPASGQLITNPYAWTLTARPAGSAAELSSTSTVTTTLTFDVAGTYEVLLTVTAVIDGSTAQTQNQRTQSLLVDL